MNFFCQTVTDWLRVTEATLHDLQITPNGSISQVSSKSRRKPKASSCGTTSSRSSKTNSSSAARAKEVATIAELQAAAHALKQRQLLHETELRLKKQEHDLQLKKDELKLETEYAKAWLGKVHTLKRRKNTSHRVIWTVNLVSVFHLRSLILSARPTVRNIKLHRMFRL